MAPNDLAVQAIAAAALPACTYNNGTAGVGASLTASSNGAFPAVDGYTAALNDALAINGQSTASQNGLYTLTTVGDGSNPWVLTRRSPDDANIWTNPFCVFNGTQYASTVWCSQTIVSNVGTGSINFTKAASLRSLSDCVGDHALDNYCLGGGSGINVTTGQFNASVGQNCLQNLTSGSDNIAMNYNAGVSITSGSRNVALGSTALRGIQTNNDNIAVGHSALGGVLGNSNIGIGTNAGPSLSSGNNNILIGDSVDVPTGVTSNYLNIGGAITGDMTTGPALMNGFTATTQASSDSSTKVASTAFVQNVVGAITAGLDSRPSSRVATTAALTATYSNGSSGVGATLTNSGTKSAITIDGVALSASDRVLVKNQATAAQNGIYTVTTVGSGSVNWVLTRATDFNTASGTGVVEGAFTIIEEGTSNVGSLWIETGAGPFTIGTTAITFTQLQVTSVTDAGIIFSDITTNNVSTSKHGFAPKAPNDATQYLDGSGAYSVPAGTVGVTYNAIAGCLPSSMAGTSTTASMTVSSGQAANSTNAVYITGAGYSWAVSNGNAINGYQGGTTLPNSSTIHMFLCTGASGTGTFASTSLTPTLPTGYAVSYRRIFSFKTNGSGAPLPYTAVEVEGGAVVCWLTTQVLDGNATSIGTSRTLLTLSIPTGVKMQPIYRARSSASSNSIIFTSPDETDVAPSGTGWSWTTAPGDDVTYGDGTYTTTTAGGQLLITNTSGQIGARAHAASDTLYLVTRGFKDFRRA